MHKPKVSSIGSAGRFKPQAHREPRVTGAGQWRVFHVAQRATMMTMPHLKFAAADPSRLKFLANELPFAKSFVKMSETRQLP
jgi:hypothetical protein